MVPWSEVFDSGAPDAGPPDGAAGRLRPATVVVPGVIAIALALLGHVPAAAVLVVVVAIVTQASYVSPAFAHWVTVVTGRVGHAVGRFLSAVLLGLVHLVLFVPLSVVGLFRRRDLGHPRPAAPFGWLDRETVSGRPSPGRPFDRRASVKGNALVRFAGILLLVLAADLVIGALLGVTRVLPGDRAVQIERQRVVLEGQASSPAVQDDPWAEQYYEEALERSIVLTPEYVPFLIYEEGDFSSTFVNVEDGVRRSYQQAVPPDGDPLQVAFFGGSTTFGEGQRDEHTIPSEFARLAEDAGVPVDVTNFGASGWGIWQEFMAFEDVLADGGSYDLVVFYDGFNDFAMQDGGYSPDPTHGGVQFFQQFAEDFHEQNSTYPGFLDPFREIVSAYANHSAVIKTIDWATSPGLDQAPVPPAVTASEERKTDAALDLYGRAVARIEDLAADHDTPVEFFWQPREAGWDTEIISRLPAGTHDVSGVFDEVDPDEIYTDVVHTNEMGARMVAEAMWAELAPVLEQQAGGA